MSTVGALVDRVVNVWLEGTYRPQYNQLAAPLDDVATEFRVVNPLVELARGSLIAIDDELFYVVDRNVPARSVTVVRGVRGTAAAPHALDATVEVTPRFPRFLIREGMRRELVGWPPTIYRVLTVDATVAPYISRIPDLGIEADAQGVKLRAVLSVRRKSGNLMDDRMRPVNGFRFEAFDGTVQLDRPIGMTSTLTLIGASDFGENATSYATWTDDDDLQSLVGLDEQWEEILELGAAGRLLIGRQAPRLFPEAEGQARSAQEVTEVGMARLGQSYLKMRDDLIGQASQDLYRLYGFSGVGNT